MASDKFKSRFPGDNKSPYSDDGVGPYGRSHPSFSDQDGMRNSKSHDRDASYGGVSTPGEGPRGELFARKVGKVDTAKVKGVGLPPPYGGKGHRK